MPLTASRRLPAALLVAAATLTACGNAAGEPAGGAGGGAPLVARVDRPASAFSGTLVDPPLPRPELTLRDTTGKPFTLTDRPPGEVTVVFFGYTHCPDVCPTTMADLAAARRQLPPDVRERVTVAFVTEDPKRDTPKVLRGWLERFDPGFVGLRGGNAATQRALQQLHLPETKRIPLPDTPVRHPEDGHEHPGEYGLEHAGIVYAFGPDGSTVLYTGGTTRAQYAEDFTRLAARA